MSEEELKNKMDTFIECYKNGMIFGTPTDIEFYEKIATLQQKVEQLEKENEKLKQPQVFIDCEDMEERYGRDLYEDYLKEKIEQLENIRKEAIKWVKLMGKYENGSCTRNFKLMSADFNYLLNILNKGSDKE